MPALRWICGIGALGMLLFAAPKVLTLLLVARSPLSDNSKPVEVNSELSRLMWEAQKVARSDNHQQAAELYTKALAIEPGPNFISRNLHALRGSEYNFLDMPDLAFTDFDAAIRIDYSTPLSDDALRAYLGRGFAALSLQRYALAKDDFDIVLKILPNDVPRSSMALSWRGAAWQGLGDRGHADADYKAALALDPKNERARNGLRDLREGN